jgi:hypothetical protein
LKMRRLRPGTTREVARAKTDEARVALMMEK